MNIDANEIIRKYQQMYADVLHENILLKSLLEAKESEEEAERDNHDKTT